MGNKPDQPTWAESFERAKRLSDERMDRIVKEIGEGKIPTPDEQAVMIRKLTEVDNEAQRAAERLDEAQASGDPDRIADAIEAFNRADSSLEQVRQVADASGSAAGAAFNMRRALAAKDFSYVRLKARAERAQGGKPLDPADRAELAKLANEKQAAEKRIAELEEQVANQEPQTNKLTRTRNARKDFDTAWDDFRKLTEGRLFANPLDPEMIKAGIKVARAAIRLGAAKIGDFLDEVGKKLGKPITDEQKTRLTEVWNQAQAEQRTEKNERYKGRIEKNESAKSNIARELAKDAIERGVNQRGGRDAVVDEVWERLKEFRPETTRREVMDAISGYGDYKALNKDPVAAELRDVKGQLQQEAKLLDMAAGEAPKRTGIERRTPSAEERELIKQVEEAKKKGGYSVTDPETQLKSALDAQKTRMRNQIEDLTRQIESGKKTIKVKNKLQRDKELTELTRQRDELKEAFDAIFSNPALKAAERLQLWKENLKKRTAELQRKLDTGDFSKKERPAPPEPDRELLELQVKNKKIADQVNAKMREIEHKNRTSIEKAFHNTVDVANNATRNLMSSVDAPIGRQGFMPLITHPVQVAKAIPEMWRAFFSQQSAERSEVKRENRENFKNGNYNRMRIDFTKEHGEEGFASRLFAKLKSVPVVGRLAHVPEMSERAFRVGMNRVRADVADTLLAPFTAKKGGPTAGDLQVLGNFVNVTTGRLTPSNLKNAVNQLHLATLFFAPQYTISRVLAAAGQPIWYKSFGKNALEAPAARKAVAREYVKMALAMTTAATLIKSAKWASDSDYFDIGIDPRNADFLQFRMGNTRIDLSGGLKQYGVAVARILTGKTVNEEGVEKATGPRDVLGQLTEQKLSPMISGVKEAYTGKDIYGRPVSKTDVLLNRVLPVYSRDVVDSARDLGLPAAMVPWLLGIHGFGVNTYTRDDEKIGQLVEHSRAPMPKKKLGEPFESYQRRLNEWQTQREGAQKVLDRSNYTPERQEEALKARKRAQKEKRLIGATP